MRTGASGKPSWVCFTHLILRTHTTLKKIPRIHGLEWRSVFFLFFFCPPPPQNGEFSERSDNRIFYRKKSGAKFITRGFLLEKVCKTRHILRRKRKKSEVAIFRQSVSGGRQNKAASLKTFVLCCLTSSRIWLISSCVDDRHLLDKIVKKKKKKPCLSVMHGEPISEWIVQASSWIFHICKHFWRCHSQDCIVVWICIQRENIRTSERWLHTSSFVVSPLLTHTQFIALYKKTSSSRRFALFQFFSSRNNSIRIRLCPACCFLLFCFYARLTTKALIFLLFLNLFRVCFCCVFCWTSSWFVGLGIPCSETVKFCC